MFMHPDGRTLYFSSKGHNSMGGFDLYKTELTDGKWSKPENMGFPINTPDDDVFFLCSRQVAATATIPPSSPMAWVAATFT